MSRQTYHQEAANGLRLRATDHDASTRASLEIAAALHDLGVTFVESSDITAEISREMEELGADVRTVEEESENFDAVFEKFLRGQFPFGELKEVKARFDQAIQKLVNR